MGEKVRGLTIGARGLREEEIKKVLPTYEKIFEQINNIREQISQIDDLEDGSKFGQQTNSFGIIGKRGTGKTSILFTIKEKLKEEKQDIILPILVPDNMAPENEIMGAILGMFLDEVSRLEKKVIELELDRKFYGESLCRYKKKESLREVYNRMIKAYCYIQPAYKQILIQKYTDLTSYTEKSSRMLNGDIEFKNAFNAFIYSLIDTKNKIIQKEGKLKGKIPLIHIFIDDIDLSPYRCIEIANILLAYLSHPALIIHLSGDIEIFEESLTLNFLKLGSLMLPQDLLNKEVVGGKTVLNGKQELAYEYLKKVIPPIYRQQLNYWSLNTRGLYSISSEHADKNLTLQELLINLLGEEQVGSFFAIYHKEKSKEVLPVAYHLFDETARGLNNVYSFLMEEYIQRTEEKKEDYSSDEEFVFKKKFINILINSNPRLNKCKNIIEQIICWGENQVKTIIRIDNLYNEINKVEEYIMKPEAKQLIINERVLDVFALFEITFLVYKVFPTIRQDEIYDDSKKKVLGLLLKYPMINGSTAEINEQVKDKIDQIIKVKSNESMKDKIDEDGEEWYIKNLILDMEFDFAIHYYNELVGSIGYRYMQDKQKTQDSDLDCYMEAFAKAIENYKSAGVVENIKNWSKDEKKRKLISTLFLKSTIEEQNKIYSILLQDLKEQVYQGIKTYAEQVVEKKDKVTIPKSNRTENISISKYMIDRKLQNYFLIYFTQLVNVKINDSNGIDVLQEVEKLNGKLEGLINKLNSEKEEIEEIEDKEIEDDKDAKDNTKKLLRRLKDQNLQAMRLCAIKKIWNKDWTKDLIKTSIEKIFKVYIEVDKSGKHNMKNKNIKICMPSEKVDDFVDKYKSYLGIAADTSNIINKILNKEDVEKFNKEKKYYLSIDDYLEVYILFNEIAINNRIRYGQIDAQRVVKSIDNSALYFPDLDESVQLEIQMRLLCQIGYIMFIRKDIQEVVEIAHLVEKVNEDILLGEEEYKKTTEQELKEILGIPNVNTKEILGE